MKKLLVVVDMQNDFVTGCLGTKEAQEIVPKVVEFIKSFDGDVIYTQDTHSDEYYLDTQEGKRLPVKHCIENTEGWKLVPEIKSVLKDTAVGLTKRTFGSRDLFEYFEALEFLAPDEVHFVGVCTGICVISNAVIVKTANPEVRIVIHKDLCACVTPETHETALKAMQTLQMDIE